jgi:hypothetical protein
MKKIIVLMCFILLGGIMYAQKKIVQNGNTFTEVSETKETERVVLTQYKYVASDGNTYPIYLSKNNKYFIIRKSQKTGKEYRQYLPQVKQKLEEIKNKQ